MFCRTPHTGLALTVALALVSGCSDGSTSQEPETQGLTVVVEPSNVTVDPGQSTVVTAYILQNGQRVVASGPAYSVTWSISDPKVATVTSLGAMASVTGMSGGATQIEAEVLATGTAIRAEDQIAVVTRPAVTALRISGGNDQQGTAGSPLGADLVVQAVNRDGVGVAGAEVTFAVRMGDGSVTPRTVQSDNDGYARTRLTLGAEPGLNKVEASIQGVPPVTFEASGLAAPAQLQIAQGNEQEGAPSTALQFPLAVRVLDATLRPLAGVTVSWTVTAGGGQVTAASISDNAGVAIAYWTLGSSGTQTVRARVGQLTADFNARVASQPAEEPPPSSVVSSLVITPQSLALNALGKQAPLSAATYDAAGQPVYGQSINWTSSNPMIATVDNAGRVTAKAVGTALIIATALCCDKADTTGVTVTQDLASVSVSPKTTSLVVGASAQLSASGLDANGNPIPSAPISWSSSNPAVASVSGGVVNALTAGTAYIRAVSGSKKDSAAVSVSASPSTPAPTPVLTTITLSPTSPTLVVGATQTFTATAKDQNGNVMAGQSFTWTSSNTNVMRVSQGVVTAVAVGLATLNVSSSGVNASTPVTVVSAPTPPPTNGTFSPPDIAFTNIENGTTAPFATTSGSVTGNADIVIMNDPTGQFGGKVARFRFLRASTTVSADVNRALRYVSATGVGLGQTIFLRGHVLIPTPAANMMAAQRKLFYIQRQQNDLSFAFLKAEGQVGNGQELKIEITGNRLFHAGTISYDKKTSIEIQITNNSAVGRADGLLRIWVDGNLVLDKSGIEFLTTSAPFVKFMFGQQTQHQLNDKSITFDEYRYWDNMALSTKRIGP